MLKLGVDAGGTLPDICRPDAESGRVWIEKLPSTPHDQSLAFLAAEVMPGVMVSLSSNISRGGGWGDPRRRDPAAVETDLRDGSITPGHAHNAYRWDGARGGDQRGMEGGRS